jgi:hypothetical protein
MMLVKLSQGIMKACGDWTYGFTMKVNGQLHGLAANPGESVPIIHRTGGWVRSSDSPDNVEKRRISCLCRESSVV